MALINRKILMSDARYFGSTGLNPFSSLNATVDVSAAQREHESIRSALTEAGAEIIQVASPQAFLDGVYTANWALCIDDTVVYAKLPASRAAELPYVRSLFDEHGQLSAGIVRRVDAPYLFSGQGDALLCGKRLFCGQGYRTDPRMHVYLADMFPQLQIVSLQTVPALDDDGRPVINAVTGLPDSLFYDLDLALSIISPEFIAWCPEAFTLESQSVIREMRDIAKIEVSYEEATTGFACNLISTGETVVMSNRAPKLRAELEAAGFRTITPEVKVLAEGGGFIRCVGLTLEH